MLAFYLPAGRLADRHHGRAIMIPWTTGHSRLPRGMPDPPGLPPSSGRSGASLPWDAEGKELERIAEPEDAPMRLVDRDSLRIVLGRRESGQRGSSRVAGASAAQSRTQAWRCQHAGGNSRQRRSSSAVRRAARLAAPSGTRFRVTT
jgi:hypothetical protein